MRPEENPLDLNNLPDEYGKQVLQDSSSSGFRKNRSGLKDAKDEKLYECRFCSLKFCKSQALGGHMNRHRQERETETLNHARQLVYRNDHNLTTQAAPHPHLGAGCCQPITAGGSYEAAATSNMVEPTMRVRFPSYMSSTAAASSSIHHMPPPQPQQQHFLYYSHPHSIPVNDYYCIGAPVALGVGGGGVKNHDEGVSWGKSCSAINRFHA